MITPTPAFWSWVTQHSVAIAFVVLLPVAFAVGLGLADHLPWARLPELVAR